MHQMLYHCCKSKIDLCSRRLNLSHLSHNFEAVPDKLLLRKLSAGDPCLYQIIANWYKKQKLDNPGRGFQTELSSDQTISSSAHHTFSVRSNYMFWKRLQAHTFFWTMVCNLPDQKSFCSETV